MGKSTLGMRAPIPGIAPQEAGQRAGYPWDEGFCCMACTCLPGSAPLHRLECHGAATAGSCALRQLCGKERAWSWPLLELTWEE